MKKLILTALLLASLATLQAADRNFEVTVYGAKGDGLTKNTVALQTAIDACAAAGGGKVVFPKGKYLTGSLTLRSNVELHLDEDATLLGSTHLEDYPPHPFPKFRSLRDKGGFPALIYAEEAEHVAITGPGTIDGQGAAFQPAKVLNNEDIRPRIQAHPHQQYLGRAVRGGETRLRLTPGECGHRLDDCGRRHAG